eukprot:Skav235539  [mRNA]  locus=scaffold3067:163334:165610:- [translate_table: standard]
MMARRRWLCLWVRNDVQVHHHVGSFKFGIQRDPWDGQEYDFPIPFFIEEQLILTDSLISIYGDVRFLPAAKKAMLPEHPDCQDVLEARRLVKGSVVPTICASYSRQHKLQIDHLEAKGICAVLVKGLNGWKFFDPFKIAAMLGATKFDAVVFASKVEIIYHHLGNATSTQHALLAILVALSVLGHSQVSISDSIIGAWNDRIRSTNVVIQQRGDFVWIIPDNLLSQKIKIPRNIVQGQAFEIEVNGTCLQIENVMLDHLLQLCQLLVKNNTCAWTHEGDVISGLTRLSNLHFPWIELKRERITLLQVKISPSGVSRENESTMTHATHDELESAQIAWRSQLAIHYGTQLASDEAVVALDMFRKVPLNVCFLPVVTMPRGCSKDRFEDQLYDARGDILHCIASKKKMCLLVLTFNHWFGVEVTHEPHDCAQILFLNATCEHSQSIIASYFTRLCMQAYITLKSRFAVVPSPDGMCGWLILNRWRVKHEMPFAFLCFGNLDHRFIVFHDEHGPLHGLTDICRFARSIRTLNIFSTSSDPVMHIFFGATGDDDMEGKTKSNDPWLSKDPWAKEGRFAKWEDLKLREDHEFFSGGVKLQQVVKQQLTSTKGGIAFGTKSGFAEIFQRKPKETSVLIVPNNDKKHYTGLCGPDAIKGPIEIVVEDPVAKSLYKRSVLVICLSGSVEIKREKPTYTAKLDPMKEMVLEIDSRVSPKECIAALAVRPLETIRAKVPEQFGTKAAGFNIFGHRMLKKPDDVIVHPC